MDIKKSLINHSNLDNLWLLFWLRNLAVFSQCGVIFLSITYYKMSLPLSILTLLITVLIIFNAYTFIRIKYTHAISDIELLIQLCVDAIVLTGLLAITGGTTNPFAVFLLLSLTISAIILPIRLTWTFAVLTICLYSLIMIYHKPMPYAHSHMNEFSLHIFGMWLSFILSALVISYFVTSLRRVIFRQNDSLTKSRERTARNEELVKLGILSASTAHDMGTPLNNVSLIVDDIMHEEAKDQPDLLSKLDILNDQVTRCRDALSILTCSTGNAELKGGRPANTKKFITKLIQNWKRSHNDINIQIESSGDHTESTILADDILQYAFINILDNAAQASPDSIQLKMDYGLENFSFTIEDQGPGLPTTIEHTIGQKQTSTKNGGLGLGLYLTHAILERLGGIVKLYNQKNGGLLTHIELPLIDVTHE